jgi:spore cortex formation protein SpoVR/YcgB (stage V sporulation)
MSKLLFDKHEWDFDTINKTWDVIDSIGQEYGLDYYRPQIEIISAEQMLSAYSSNGLPNLYSHWSFGKSYLQHLDSYKTGRSMLAYEIVINSDPCIAYLMEDNCVDGDTEYLSPTGWKNIKDYSGEEVLGFNPDDTAEFVKPKRYIISKVSHPMISISGKGTDQLVTEKHRVIYRKRNGELAEDLAKNIYNKHKGLKQGWDGKIITAVNLKKSDGIDLSDDQIRVMCAVHADGCFSSSGNYCKFEFKKKIKVYRLIGLLNNAKIKFNLNIKPNGNTHISFSAPIKTKHFTEYWYGCSSGQLKIIADEVFHWDADLKLNNQYYSSDIEDINFVQYSCIANGICATYSKGPTCFRLTKSSCIDRRIGSVDKRENDKAYCFEMPSTMWVARRNGKVFVTGNSMTMQTLVMSHAVCGHGSFFKNNYLFKQNTDASWILDYLEFAKKYIAKCESLYGEKEVDIILTAAHALSNYGIDSYSKSRHTKKGAEERKRRELEEYKHKTFDEDLYKLDLHRECDSNVLGYADNVHSVTGNLLEPEENILYYIEKRSPVLSTWQREIVRIVRRIAQYFYPQMQTQVMNEGWACLWHYHILKEMYERGYINEGSYLEFLASHTNVVYQPPMDSMNINPYYLGFNMFMDIKRMCENPDEEDKRHHPDICNTDWIETTKFIMENYRDSSFIKQYFSLKMLRELKLYSAKELEDKSSIDDFDFFMMPPGLRVYEIQDVHDDKGFNNLRNSLAEQYNLLFRRPKIEIVNENTIDHGLGLRYYKYNEMDLNEDSSDSVLSYIKLLWGREVTLTDDSKRGEE